MRCKQICRFFAAIVFVALSGIEGAKADCTSLPYNLTNGQVADATQVMANFNALLACVNKGQVNSGTAGQVGYYAANGTTLSGQSLSDLLDASIGSTRGAVLERGATGWALLTPGASGNVLTSNGAGADPSYLPAGNGARGLLTGLMSPTVPSQSATGFTTWLHQGSTTESDVTPGMNFTSGNSGNGSHYLSGLVQAAPTTPYTRTILVIPSGNVPLPNFNWIVFGWYDGTAKLQTITYYAQGIVQQINYTSTTSVSSNTNVTTINGSWIWLQIQDDGANYYLRHSFDGVKFNTDVTGPKSTGFLGATGYANLFLGVDDYHAYSWTVVSYQ